MMYCLGTWYISVVGILCVQRKQIPPGNWKKGKKERGTSENWLSPGMKRSCFHPQTFLWLHVPQLSTVVLSPFSLPPKLWSSREAISITSMSGLSNAQQQLHVARSLPGEMLECSVRRSVLAPKDSCSGQSNSSLMQWRTTAFCLAPMPSCTCPRSSASRNRTMPIIKIMCAAFLCLLQCHVNSLRGKGQMCPIQS